MIVPAHWAEARLQSRVAGRQITTRRFGWSDVSAAEAQAMADERARRAHERIAGGEDLARSEPKVPYNGAEGVPIREEIVQRHGETIVTRNSYGALCLNTPDVLFADVDHAQRASLRSNVAFTLAAVLLSSWLGGEFAGTTGRVLGALVGAVVGPVAVHFAWPLLMELRGGVEAVALRRVRKFVERHPRWLLDLYETPKGLRLLALHTTFDPAGDEARSLFEAIGADPIYVRMCARQRCFRARVSPKPWRIGIAAHMKPRPGVWPVDPERLPERQRWIANYERSAQRFASCRYLETLGEGTVDSRTSAVRALHDRLARAREMLPIA